MRILKNRKGQLFTFPIILGLAIAIPLFIFGIGAVMNVFKLMNSPVVKGSIPIWAIFVVGIIIVWVMRKF